MDLRTLVDGVVHVVSNTDLPSSNFAASSELKLDLLHLTAASGVTAKQLLKTVCDDIFNTNIFLNI